MTDHEHLSAQATQAKGRKVFLLMLTFFVVPIIVVILMYQFNWKPSGVSAGELIKPARLLSIPDLQTDKQEAVTVAVFREKWSLVYLADECTQVCIQKLSDMRQLHVSLYKDIPRTQRILITNTDNTADIKALFPDLLIINQPSEAIDRLVQQFVLADKDASELNTNVMQDNHLYLVDPLGHLMMRYQPDVPLAQVRKDVARLLRYSWAG